MSYSTINTRINNEVGRCTAFTFIFWVQTSHEDPISEQRYWFNYLLDFLNSLRTPCAVSPCHDHDINEIDVNTGEVEYKKAHWHVVVDFGSGNNKTIKQIFDLLKPIRSFISITPWDKLLVFDEVIEEDLAVILKDFDILYKHFFEVSDDSFEKLKKLWLSANTVRNMRSLLRYFKHLDNPEKYQYLDPITSIGGFEVEDRIYSQTDSYYLLDQIFDFIEEQHMYSYWRLLKYCRKNNREWYSVMCKNQFSNMIINAMKSFAYDDTGALDKQIDKYENK